MKTTKELLEDVEAFERKYMEKLDALHDKALDLAKEKAFYKARSERLAVLCLGLAAMVFGLIVKLIIVTP